MKPAQAHSGRYVPRTPSVSHACHALLLISRSPLASDTSEQRKSVHFTSVEVLEKRAADTATYGPNETKVPRPTLMRWLNELGMQNVLAQRKLLRPRKRGA